ncbi:MULTISPECIES: alpha/beta hydrolase-fold protein [unclassified Pseudoalteromonas]|uniref:alpha/beta hydrolase-fold protein n=1 Tax=unclassified Pseudoalteromonas TaxID=194690 RepID=UPI000CF5EEEE|nr:MULTISPECIES: alpha/beta hydrolase-fold protein [unclassified Pseudoalteromonas]MBS3797583.1 alpha/beta hydrolase [Pseudoalteromonas sp. BDTF-M6]
MFKKIVILLLAFFLSSEEVNANVRGTSITDSLYSTVLSEQRDLLVHLPNNYKENKTLNYPVLYLLDGQRNFAHTIGTLDLLNQSSLAQEMIIIAIKNTHRTRDFTPTYDQSYNEWGISGGADDFLDFIEKELIPYVNKKYRANNFKIVSGHSLGGLLSIYALQSRPELFQAHFAFSPSLWWHKQVIFKEAESFLNNSSKLNTYLYVNMGSEGGHMLSSYERYTKLLNSHNRKGFKFNSDLDTSETHNTTALAGHSLAFQKLYASLRPGHETIAKGIPAIKEFYKKQSEIYGYEIKPSYGSINRVAYNALEEKDFATAISIFKENAKNYPYKADAYDSLADGYEANGELEKALEMRNLVIKKSIIENIENNAYKTRLINLNKLIKANNP